MAGEAVTGKWRVTLRCDLEIDPFNHAQIASTTLPKPSVYLHLSNSSE